jgi:hypothetical protein
MGACSAKVDLFWYEIYTRLRKPFGFRLVLRDTGFELTSFLFEGKILNDANTVESYKIEEKGFIVCMVSKVSGTLYF